MKTQKLILKFDAVCERNNYGLRRIEGTVNADSIIRLIDCADLAANPREAKTGNVTDEIIESLGMDDGLFHFKSKGILIAAGECRALERQRYELNFSDEAFEGVLDGGHNLLAIALFLLQKAIGEDDARIKKLKRWDDLKPVWLENRSAISEIQSELNFYVPLEIIHPQPGQEGIDAFEGAILDIAQARNNNAELTLEAKANKAGYYDDIRMSLDPSLVNSVEWKSNDGGRIKVRDLVALSWIPLSLLPNELPGRKEFNPIYIYSSKGMCAKLFNKLIEDDSVSKETKGAIRKVEHEGVKSAVSLMKDIPKLYDLIYKKFPGAYNATSPGFGRIDKVRGKQTGNRKILTKFYRSECDYDYPDGFIMPVVFALSALMERKGNKVEWMVDPHDFIEDNLSKVLEIFYSTIQMAKYDPQTVGKSGGSYNLAVSAFKFQLR